jgi:hypothetical protein
LKKTPDSGASRATREVMKVKRRMGMGFINSFK